MLVPGHITEKKALKKLGISDFGTMPIDKISTFVSFLPYMDKDVALKVIAQFPKYIEFEKELLSSMQHSLEITCKSNQENMQAIYVVCTTQIDRCNELLKADNLSEDERKRLEEMILEIIKLMCAKDTENKKLLNSWVEKALGCMAALGFASLIMLGAGGKIDPPRQDDSDDPEEEDPD